VSVERPIATVALMRHGGSHLIRPIVDKFGFDIIEPGNFKAPLDQAIGPVIVFLRDPRNRMGATLRWWANRGKLRSSVSNAVADDQMTFLLRDKGFLEEMLRWARVWCNWPSPKIIVRFESVNYDVMRSLSSHLGLSEDNERDRRILIEVYGNSRTFTGNHTNWRDYFGPNSLAYWNKNGGIELLKLMGYW
jgi:hypothetical protein